jgi:hypothetical protein
MKHFLRNMTIGLLAAGTIAFLWTPGARAAVRTERPRIWLTPELKTTLQARLARNTTNARNLKSWCDGHMTDDLSGYVGSRATEVLRAINHALMYQLTGNTAYANRAVQIVEYALAHPYTGYTANTWIEFDNFYTTRYLVPPVAIVLDWCYDAMTVAQRTAFANQLDWWANDIMTSSPWSWHDPSNNYYYGHMWAILSAGYAIYGLNANAQTYIDYARGTMLDQAIKFTKDQTIMWELWGSTVGRAKGGQWNEGTAYGCVNYEFLGSSVLAVKSAEGLPYSDFTFPDEAVKYHIYSKHPTGGRMYSDGDGAAGGIDATVRIPVLFCMALATGDTKGYGQQWVNSYTTNCDWSYKLYNEFLWYDDQLAAIPFSSLPDYYYLEGNQVLFWRSSWSTDGIWLALKLGTLNTDHAHNGLGNLMIYKQGFLATDKAAETGDGMAFSDLDHNVLYIAPGDDKRLYWGESALEHLASTANYLYLAGNLSGPYLAQPSYRNNTVTHKEREILIIKPENVIAVMDRGTSTDTAHDKIFQMYLHAQAVASGTDYRSSNGSADLVLHRAYPSGSTVSLDTYGAPRLRISTAAASLSKSFLNLLKVTSVGGALTAPQATSSTTDVAAAAFIGANDPVDYVAAFSTDPEGDPTTASSFSISFDRSHSVARAYLANLSPNTAYYISGTTAGATGTVTVSRTSTSGATAYQSGADGFIFCEVNLGETEQPPPPPHPVRID